MEEYLICEDCNVQDEKVDACHCPYAEEISGELVPATLCSQCYHERCMDI